MVSNEAFLNFLGISLTFIYMKNVITRSAGVELKFKLSLREIGQLIVYVIFVLLYSVLFTWMVDNRYLVVLFTLI